MPSRRELGFVFVAALAFVTALNASVIAMPPVWDAAPGAFAPAIYLYENDFDLPGLLAAPGYIEGGPNVHSLSWITFLTLAAITVTGGDPALYLPGLHILNFALAALTATVTFALAGRFAGRWIAGLLATALLLFPLFRVQTGAIYTEVAGAALLVLAVASFQTRRFGPMAVFSALACATKSFGIVAVAALGLLVLVDSEEPLARRVRRCASLAIPAVIIEGMKWVTAAPCPGEATPFPWHLVGMLRRLLSVPDLFALIVLALAVAYFHVSRRGLLPCQSPAGIGPPGRISRNRRPPRECRVRGIRRGGPSLGRRVYAAGALLRLDPASGPAGADGGARDPVGSHGHCGSARGLRRLRGTQPGRSLLSG
ncbi:MAG: hypothetical protein HQ581_10225 [Planctomycetes bacterium]|nr:hypothetical protein [Planctomycetota bacterium]